MHAATAPAAPRDPRPFLPLPSARTIPPPQKSRHRDRSRFSAGGKDPLLSLLLLLLLPLPLPFPRTTTKLGGIRLPLIPHKAVIPSEAEGPAVVLAFAFRMSRHSIRVPIHGAAPSRQGWDSTPIHSPQANRHPERSRSSGGVKDLLLFFALYQGINDRITSIPCHASKS